MIQENSLHKTIDTFAFTAPGYKPEQVTTILLTHKHGDHSGKLRSFPNAKIYVNNESNLLHNRTLRISGIFKETEKPDIEVLKEDIEKAVLTENGKSYFEDPGGISRTYDFWTLGMDAYH